MQRTILLFLLLLINSPFLSGQQIPKSYRLHSHNDYLQTVPFWEAYANQMESIEADILLMDNELYVAHEKESILKDRTLASLYLDPIREAFELNFGGLKEFQLLIDIKTEPYSTLKKLEEVLSSYEDILIGEKYASKVEIVISGNRPNPEEYINYPDYIRFDYQSVSEVSDLPLEKIALVSLNFKKFSDWNGTGQIIEKDEVALKRAIEVAHSLNKPIRFWATPDTTTAWEALKELGVDFINTDQPYEARSHFKNPK